MHVKFAQSLSLAALLGLGLSACGNDKAVSLTPPPLVPPGTVVKYTQIERLSRPAIKEVFEPFQDHQKSNAVDPDNDPTIQNDIVATENALRPPTATTNYGKALAGVLYPDEYLVNLEGGAPTPTTAGQYFLSADLANGFGGRAPNDDVINLELGSLFGNLLVPIVGEDNEENNCLASQNIAGFQKFNGQDPSKLTTNVFPYLPAAH
ncbi:MAG: hypothetical protein NVSMB64_28590 [Candidatus Velthaea sp.]